MNESWETVLDEFERRIESGKSSLETGAPLEPFVMQPFVPPSGIGTLPEHLVDRAIGLLQRNHDVESDLASAMSDIRTQLTKSGEQNKRTSNPFSQSSAPRYFDGAV